MRNRQTPAPSSTWCAAPRLGIIRRGLILARLRTPPTRRRRSVEEEAMNQDIRAPYYGELGRMSFSPGWARPEPAMWPSPRPKFRPAVWRYTAAKAALDQAGEFVPVEQAERRNLRSEERRVGKECRAGGA